MNDAQLHLILNHYPILGTLFRVLLAAYGFFAKNKSLILYIITLVAGLAVFGYMARVGGLGGQIRHTELRE